MSWIPDWIHFLMSWIPGRIHAMMDHNPPYKQAHFKSAPQTNAKPEFEARSQSSNSMIDDNKQTKYSIKPEYSHFDIISPTGDKTRKT